MPAPKGEKYWAKWCYDYCQIGKISRYPNRDYAKVVDLPPKTVGSLVNRMRKRGLIVRMDNGTHELTQHAIDILKTTRGMQDGGVVAFDLKVRARSKTAALAEVWDVITQLEQWDPRSGEPFRLQHERLKKLGVEDKG